MKIRTKILLAGVVVCALLVVVQTNLITKDNRPKEKSSKEKSSKEITEQKELPKESVKEPAAKKEVILEKEAGSTVNSDVIDWQDLDQYFKSSKIDDKISERINNRSYRENSDIGLAQLRYLKLLHYNYDHQIQVGELIVNADIAGDCQKIFRELFEQEYEIEGMRLVDHFWTGDADSTDIASMEANNSSAFCYRVKTNGKSLSNHALGYAIDINPVENPYVSGDTVLPASGKAYTEREAAADHMIDSDDLCCKLFKKHGFTWGGDWKNPKDYQHFEKQ